MQQSWHFSAVDRNKFGENIIQFAVRKRLKISPSTISSSQKRFIKNNEITKRNLIKFMHMLLHIHIFVMYE